MRQLNAVSLCLLPLCVGIGYLLGQQSVWSRGPNDPLTAAAVVHGKPEADEVAGVPAGAEGCIVFYLLCFDFDVYRSLNPDLPAAWTAVELWIHFSEHGYAEARRFEYYCAGAPMLAQSKARGACLGINSTCFDFEFYRRHSADLVQGGSREADLWAHFAQHGQREGRKFRFQCQTQAEQGLGPPGHQTLQRLWAHEHILPPDALLRGVERIGGGDRLNAFAHKLLSGEAVSVVTVGGSVTHGAGASNPKNSYPERIFRWIESIFPRWPETEAHSFQNSGVPASNSVPFAMCTDKLVLPFSFDDGMSATASMTTPVRRSYEQLLRRLLALPNAPAVVVLAYYSWFYARPANADNGVDGPLGPFGYFYESAEAAHLTFAQYYDLPSLSLRSAVYPLFLEGREGFKIEYINRRGGSVDSHLQPPAGDHSQYFYHDGMHPSEEYGHRSLADLAIYLLQKTIAGALKTSALGDPPIVNATLPRPMIFGNANLLTSLCLQEGDFEPVARDTQGFAWMAERPDADSFLRQKWGWTASDPGSWVNLMFDTRTDQGAAAPAAAAAAAAAAKDSNGSREAAAVAAAAAGPLSKSVAYIGYLRSYEGMGSASVECTANCTCDPTVLEGAWGRKASLTQFHVFEVTPHQHCVVRVSVREATLSGSHKVSLRAAMVGQEPARTEAIRRMDEKLR